MRGMSMLPLAWLILLLGLGLTPSAMADTDVTGRYLAGGGSDVQILLTIQEPPPAAFIVQQQIPQGVKMTAADPAPSGLQQEGGVIKWLFKRPQPGSVILTLQLSKQVMESQLAGEISYRHPRSGTLIIRKINY